MKSSISFRGTTRNTHQLTMVIAYGRIANSSLEDLEQIATRLQQGMHSNSLNKGDAKHLLSKVKRAIADRYFQ